MTLALRWRVPGRRIVTRWRGPAGMLASAERAASQPLAAIVGPPGLPGPSGLPGAPLRLAAPLAATWVLPHPLGRLPGVQIVLAGGESVIADVAASDTAVTVVFASPQAGTAILF